MTWFRRNRSFFLGMIIFLASAFYFSCARSDDNTPATNNKKPSSMPAAPIKQKNAGEMNSSDKSAARDDAVANKVEKDEADPFAVPDGSPETLIDFLKRLQNAAIPDTETWNKVRKARLEAAEKILAGKPNDEQRSIAIEIKIQAIQKPEEIEAYIEKLKKDGLAKYVRLAENCLLLKKAAILNMDDEVTRKKWLEESIAHLKKEPAMKWDAMLAYAIFRISETFSDRDYVIKNIQDLSDHLLKSKEERLADFGRMLGGVLRRLDLPGKAMKLEGVLMDGAPLDGESLKGKYVLVDFWATWCGFCVQEIPDMLKFYEFYHPKGFEIVGFSADTDRDDLVNFLKEKKLPWITVYGKDGPSATLEYYGITAFPTMLFLDKEGKVLSLDARGNDLKKELKKLLEEHLGPMPEEKKEKSENKGAAAPEENG